MDPKQLEARAERERAERKRVNGQVGIKIVVEISAQKVALRRGDHSIEIPRELFRPLYDAMVDATKLGGDESKTVELKPAERKAPSEEASQQVMSLIPW